MNHYFSPAVAILLTLFAAVLWGSWMQVVKHLRKFPIEGLVFYLYIFSFLLVWVITLILAPLLIPEGLSHFIAGKERVVIEILLGGSMMSIGMMFSLTVMRDIGLLLATALSGSIASILGILTSIMKEGLPSDPCAVPVIVTTSVIFLAASLLCNYASQLRERDLYGAQRKDDESQNKTSYRVTFRTIIFILISSVLVNGWSIGVATGTANSFPPVLTCALMVTGSLASILIYSSIRFTIKKMWPTILCVGTTKKPILFGLITGVCHYGGNLISIYAMPVISATLSFLFGRTASVWTFVWGISYGEFKGVSKKTAMILSLGIALYFAGIVLLGIYSI